MLDGETEGYGLILADPPWRYAHYTDRRRGAASAVMATMSVEDICELGPLIQESSAPDAVLALWGTWPHLPGALRVMDAWGYAYVTGVPWVKLSSSGAPRAGVGYWTRGVTEYLLIGRRGHLRRASPRSSTPAGLFLPGDVFWAPRGVHSCKPLSVHTWLEEMFPRAPCVELFARRETPGWDCYGLDLGWRITPEGVDWVGLV